MVELVGGGSVIYGAYPVELNWFDFLSKPNLPTLCPPDQTTVRLQY